MQLNFVSSLILFEICHPWKLGFSKMTVGTRAWIHSIHSGDLLAELQVLKSSCGVLRQQSHF